MDHRHIATLNLQPARSLKAKQASANDDGLQSRATSFQQSARVVEIPEYEDAFFFHLVDRRNERKAPGSQQEFVEWRHAAVVASHSFCFGIDANDTHSEPQVDVVLLIPLK